MFIVMGLSLLISVLWGAHSVNKVIPHWRGEAILFLAVMFVFSFALMIEGAERMGWT